MSEGRFQQINFSLALGVWARKSGFLPKVGARSLAGDEMKGISFSDTDCNFNLAASRQSAALYYRIYFSFFPPHPHGEVPEIHTVDKYVNAAYLCARYYLFFPDIGHHLTQFCHHRGRCASQKNAFWVLFEVLSYVKSVSCSAFQLPMNIFLAK